MYEYCHLCSSKIFHIEYVVANCYYNENICDHQVVTSIKKEMMYPQNFLEASRDCGTKGVSTSRFPAGA